MNKLSVALIHNKSAERLSHIRPKCAELCSQLNAGYFEVFDQPAIVPHGRIMAATRYAVLWYVGRDWSRHRLLKPRPLAIHFTGMLWRMLWRYGLSATPALRRKSAIEAILTGKHIATWRGFLSSGSAYLLVLEDDAVFLPNSVDRIKRIIAGADSGHQYIDVTGAFSFEWLAVEQLVSSTEDGFVSFDKPVTNGSAGYVINRKTAETFMQILGEASWLEHLPSDWLLNGLFMQAMNRGVAFDCRHASPPIFKHGSVTGEYDSSIAQVFIRQIEPYLNKK